MLSIFVKVKSASSDSNYLRLASVRASEITVGARDIQYIFTINIPESSQSIEKVFIAQRGKLEIIKFEQDKVSAYGGTEAQKELRISQANVDSKTRGLTVHFDPPVQSGQILTLSLGVNRNPFTSGQYLFDVVVYPLGRPDAISLGVGRIRITSIRDTE
ncbi:MAG: DUF2808 domain-containing protein [Calothrix sp. C42_A2020_038]|nr:DUF2808 domain-containing protein [Calothrix sp. C42_A2020_038]